MKRIKHIVRKIPDKKPYFEVIGAILSIPVLITVILLNVSNLNQSKIRTTPTPTPSSQIIIHDVPVNVTSQPNNPVATTPAPTPNVCIKAIGPISISSPQEGQTISDNPVCFTIAHDNNYCSVVWSYRINGGSWSDYNSNSPCLYNVPSGTVKFELRVQSTVSQDSTTLTRNIIYQGINPSPTPNPTGTK